MQRHKRAVCTVIFNEFDEVLTVTRRNTKILSLPGGKVDEGESDLEAAVRELQEETGCHIDQNYFIPVYAEIVLGPDGENFYCTAFVCHTKTEIKNDAAAWSCEPGISVQFSSIKDLLNHGAFSDYNRKVLEEILMKVNGFDELMFELNM